MHTTNVGGSIVTITSVVATIPTPTLSPTVSGLSTGSKSFFHNTAAVAGVFTVAGLIALAVIFVCATNAIRRRRALQFDKDVAEAAAAAANAKVPVFDDDVYSGKCQLTGYSDGSHGTYGQPPLNTDSYGMSEIHPYDTYNAGAAGVGAAVMRARSRKDVPDMAGMAGYDTNGVVAGYGEQSSPYPAFSGPSSQRVMYDTTRSNPYVSNPAVEPSGMDGLAALTRGPSLHTQQMGYSDLARSKSRGYYGSAPPEPIPVPESYPAYYQNDYQNPSAPAPAGGHQSTLSASEDPYGGYIVGEPSPQLPQESSNLAGTQPIQGGSGSEYSDGENEDGDMGQNFTRYDDNRASIRDEEDYELERGRRVLKVANE
jgi:hypothetical protein